MRQGKSGDSGEFARPCPAPAFLRRMRSEPTHDEARIMVFNSLTFLIFLAFTLLFYYKLPFKAQNIFLLGASYLFYGWWDYRFLFLLLFTSGFDYFCALLIERQQNRTKRRWLLALSL